MYIPIEEFNDRIELDVRSRIETYDIVAVVSFREITKPLAIQVMRTDYLRRLLSRVTLEGDPSCKVYAGCEIARIRIDPGQLMVGQTFVQRSKYQAILENVPKTFADFQINHGAKCTSLIIFGVTQKGFLGMAHYVPPIIERHNNHLVLLDGVHRNFLTGGIGTTIESIIISGVKTPFPCDPMPWEFITPVDEKPPREKRFANFKPHFFRDLKYVGIDG